MELVSKHEIPHAAEPTADTKVIAKESTDPFVEACAGGDESAEVGDQARLLYLLLRLSQSKDQLACAARFYARYFPDLSRERPLPTDPEQLMDWWNVVGKSAVFATFGPEHVVVLPEAPPWITNVVRRKELGPLLCAPNDRECGMEARTFLNDAEERLGDTEMHLRLLADADAARDAKAPLEADHIPKDACQKEARERASSAWSDCVARLVPEVWRLPRDRFALPTKGVLSFNRSGCWSVCRETSVFVLDSGLALKRLACGKDDGTSTLRFDVGRVDIGALRRASLLAALANDARRSPAYAVTFTTPAGTTPREYWRSHAIYRVTDVPHLSYDLSGVLPETQVGDLAVYEHMDPLKRLLSDLFSTLERTMAPRCLTEADRPAFEQMYAALERHWASPEPWTEASVFTTLRCD